MTTSPAITEVDPRRGLDVAEVKLDKFQAYYDANTFECRVVLIPESPTGFSAHATRLPGVVSQGETEAEALQNIADAFRNTIASYIEIGEAIPWENVDLEYTKGSKERWILVDV